MLSQYVIRKCTIEHQVQREKVGLWCSFVGIIANVFIAVMKMLVGLLFQSLAILADGLNNLSDAASMLVVLFSFKWSQLPADKEHPYGHQRIEYLASLIVGISIVLLFYELVKSSIDKILHPQVVEFSIIMVVVLLVSMVGKWCLYRFYQQCAKQIDSTVLFASAQDSRNDVLSTGVILVSTLVSYMFGMHLDGYMGIFVSILILLSAIDILKDAMNKLLGEAPSEEFVEKIKSKILSYDGVLGIHDLIVHSYGPERVFVCVHVEVDCRVDILQSHELVDLIEKDFLKDENLHVVIHMDPIDIDDPMVKDLYHMVKKCIKELSEEISMHDFRTVVTKSHTNLIFDCEIPYACNITFEMVQECVDMLLKTLPGEYIANIQFERPYN